MFLRTVPFVWGHPNLRTQQSTQHMWVVIYCAGRNAGVVRGPRPGAFPRVAHAVTAAAAAAGLCTELALGEGTSCTLGVSADTVVLGHQTAAVVTAQSGPQTRDGVAIFLLLFRTDVGSVHQEATQGLASTQQGRQVNAFDAPLSLQMILQRLGHHRDHPHLGIVIVAFARDGASIHRTALTAQVLVNEANDARTKLPVQESVGHVGDGFHAVGLQEAQRSDVETDEGLQDRRTLRVFDCGVHLHQVRIVLCQRSQRADVICAAQHVGSV
mmetsp:Transcript_27910/g.47743  ORF Transcript_27910/g.47743 Transcript_27910/m.47743 type:complete len:270 (+) Transcript_27910:622-1431(+)